MAKIDKSFYTKEEWHKIRQERRNQKRFESLAKTNNIENISSNEIAFVIGNGTSRLPIDLEQLKSKGIDGEYEKHEVSYTIPATHHTYKPDFRLPNNIFIESKGWFLPEDRKKHLHIKEQNPDMDLKRAGNGEDAIICCRHGEPIYRKGFYDATMLDVDEFIAHTNGEDIRNTMVEGTKEAEADFIGSMLGEAPKQPDNQIDLEDSIAEVEAETKTGENINP